MYTTYQSLFINYGSRRLPQPPRRDDPELMEREEFFRMRDGHETICPRRTPENSGYSIRFPMRRIRIKRFTSIDVRRDG